MTVCRSRAGPGKREDVYICVQGLEWVSLQWGAWSSIGMAATSPLLLARLQRQVRPATPLTGINHLQCLPSDLKYSTTPLKPVRCMSSRAGLWGSESGAGPDCAVLCCRRAAYPP